jgi:hypothetical protein
MAESKRADIAPVDRHGRDGPLLGGLPKSSFGCFDFCTSVALGAD